ncbi:MAG: hypothetical protein AAGH15_10995 [Myxococcota bacterium]
MRGWDRAQRAYETADGEARTYPCGFCGTEHATPWEAADCEMACDTARGMDELPAEGTR